MIYPAVRCIAVARSRWGDGILMSPQEVIDDNLRYYTNQKNDTCLLVYVSVIEMKAAGPLAEATLDVGDFDALQHRILTTLLSIHS